VKNELKEISEKYEKQEESLNCKNWDKLNMPRNVLIACHDREK